ncbi:MAG TPA: MarR family winged helix-turn-helix transcriptional regulator [Puia sp.]|jgi:DNA-binding MarR family transcriptional regulator|nr:MarR family winged helix-turn-helix transcriptional regulator [Puia sp.]
MSGNASSVIPLLSEWENYIQDHPAGDLPGFAHWILSRQQTAKPPVRNSPTSGQLPTTARTALLITRIYRILGVLSKPKIKSLGFTKDMEFGVLIHVAIMDHPNKKELCSELLIENSTGVEITKRLAKKGLITESPDPNDRRSARLGITEKGKKILIDGAEWFTNLHTSFFNVLDKEENEQLVNLLYRLNQYHTSQLNNNPDFLE